MKIKICGIFREEDVDYVNEAMPDFIGFVFARSRREVSPAGAEKLRRRLAPGIKAVGVFVDAPAADIAALHRDGVIDMAQLHGTEDEGYIERLKELCNVPVIKAIVVNEEARPLLSISHSQLLDYYLIDSGAGSGKTFNWSIMESGGSFSARINASGKPWFLAGGINPGNVEEAVKLRPFCVDISGGAETNGLKDREKILQLTAMVKGNSI
ncbi:MAG: phosphoribosylanthranilate isomerase [Treponema sp.]|nr:phosphoribosylanthranilate isomerase [Treponema sp.]